MKQLTNITSYTGMLENFFSEGVQTAIEGTQLLTQGLKVDPNLLNPLSLKWDSTGKTYNNRWIRLSTSEIKEVNTPKIDAIIDTITSQASATWSDIVNNYKGTSTANTLSTGVKYDDYIFYNCEVSETLERNTTTIKVPNYGDFEFKNQGKFTIYKVTMLVPPLLKNVHPNVDVMRAIDYLYSLGSELYIQSPRLESTTLQETEKVVFVGSVEKTEPVQDLYSITFTLKTVRPRPKYTKVNF